MLCDGHSVAVALLTLLLQEAVLDLAPLCLFLTATSLMSSELETKNA